MNGLGPAPEAESRLLDRYKLALAVMTDPRLTGAQKGVFGVILSFYNPLLREAWPSQSTIANRAKTSEETVKTAIRRLEELGYLRVERGGGRSRSSTYQFRDL